MAENDLLAPTDAVESTSDPIQGIEGYSVEMKNHGYAGGGRFTLVLALDPEFAESLDNWDNTEPFSEFMKDVVGRMAQKGIDIVGSAHITGRGAFLQGEEKANYSRDDGKFSSVGNPMGPPDMQDFAQPGETWREMYVTDMFIKINECFEGMTDEQISDAIRKAYFETIQGVSPENIPDIEYKGAVSGANVDTKLTCAPSVPMS